VQAACRRPSFASIPLATARPWQRRHARAAAPLAGSSATTRESLSAPLVLAAIVALDLVAAVRVAVAGAL
jgi:hypothetical protein